MNTYVVAYFSLISGEQFHYTVEARSTYEADVQVLQPKADPEAAAFADSYPTYEAIENNYLPAVEE